MPKSYLDDLTLIRSFIKGEAQLAVNDKLRVQSALNTDQLLARNGQILAIAKLKANPSQIRVRQESSYAELLDKTLRNHNFMPTGATDASGTVSYEHCQGPEGYKLFCEPARLLWRQWWLSYRHSRSSAMNVDLLIFTKQKWYPIRTIEFGRGTLFITTLRGDVALQGEDLAIWAEKDASLAQDQRVTQMAAAARIQSKVAGAPVGNSRPAAATATATAPSPTTAQTSQPHYTPGVAGATVTASRIPRSLERVARNEAGKLYIQTNVGEVVIEGVNLRCRLNRE